LSSKKKQKSKETKRKLPESSTVPKGRVTDKLMLAAFAVFIVLVTTYKIQGDDDIFWHLATGKYITETGTVPSSDVFGFVTAGERWIPFEWGWDVLTYVIYSFSGYTGISIFRTIIFLLIFYLYCKILKKLGVSKTVFIFLSIILVFGIFERLSPRPQIISYLFFVLILYLFIEQRHFRKDNIKILFFLPLIFLIWTNMHMGVISGIALFLIYVVSEILVYLNPKKYSDGKIIPLSKKNIMTLLLIFIVSLSILIINPHGYDTYSYTFSHLQMKSMSQINEWLSPFNKLFIGRFNNIIYIIFLIGAFLILYYSVKKKDVFVILLTIVFAIYSTRNVRFSVDYLFIIFIFFALSFNDLLKQIKSDKLKDFLLSDYRLKAVLVIALIVHIANLTNDNLYKKLGYIRATGFGVDGYFYPVRMIDFIKQNNIEKIGSKPFNSFENGGFFIWNLYGEKDFIDSRNLNDKIIDEYKSIEMKHPGFQQKLGEYGIDYIPWSYPDIFMYPQYMKASLVSYLVDKPDEWKLIFWDDNSFLFVKNEDKFKDLISKYEYKYINPYNFIFRRNVIDNALRTNTAGVKEEITRKFTEDPSGAFISSIYNAYYTKIKQ